MRFVQLEHFAFDISAKSDFSFTFTAQENFQHLMNLEILGRNAVGSGPGRYRTCDQSVMSRLTTLKLLNNLPTTELVKITQFSKSYISQVKSGHRPPSQKLFEALERYTSDKKIETNSYLKTVDLFLASRREGISPNTIRDYQLTLCKALKILGLSPTTKAINEFLSKLDCSLGGKYGYYKCIRAFYNWLYSPRAGLEFPPENNPVTWVEAPKRPFLILASLTKEQVELLINRASSLRDKAIIS